MQIITFSQVFHDFYTYLSGQMCKMPKSFNGPRYRCGIYCAFEDHLLVHLCCKQGSIFTFFDSLPSVNSNTVFGKITLMVLEKYSLEIEENLVHFCFGLAWWAAARTPHAWIRKDVKLSVSISWKKFYDKTFGGTQQRTFRNIWQWAWNLPGMRELACHRITAFPGELKGVLHSQEDDTNIFNSQLHNMSELYAFYHEHP